MNEQQKFEEWAVSSCVHLNIAKTDSVYDSLITEVAWRGWSARSKLDVQYICESYERKLFETWAVGEGTNLNIDHMSGDDEYYRELITDVAWRGWLSKNW